MQAPAEEKLQGEVLGVRFENPETGFRVLNVRVDGGAKITVCGTLPEFIPGQWAEFYGKTEKHPEFGRQFHAVSGEVSLPGTLDGLKRFLVSCVPGIGPRNAERIVDHFQGDTLKILDESPARLTEIPGIGAKRAAELNRVWRENSARRDGMIFLQSLGLSVSGCARLYRRYGEAAPETVRQNPYKLAEEVDGIGFSRADAIAARLGVRPDSLIRLTAAAVYAVRLAAAQGQVAVPEGKLAAKVVELTGAESGRVAEALNAALEHRQLRLDLGLIYLPYLHQAETELPVQIGRLARASKFFGQKLAVQNAAKSKFAPEQLAAICAVTEKPLSIITGGPGVGKTTVVGEIVALATAAHVKVTLAAPTGRAAKRLTEAAGAPAMTLHRLLQYDPGTNRFAAGTGADLDLELLIVDEVSMLDIQLAHALFAALRPGVSVVLVGDQDQLPSVGPGEVLRDFIKSGLFAVTRLSRIFRQAAGSGIVVGAHAVNAGKLPALDNRAPDFFWIEQEDPLAVRDLIGRLVTERIPRRFNLDKKQDIAVLTPMNRGECGTIALNEYLGNLLNPGEMIPGFQHGSRSFRRGDKVMQITNNYDKNVFNGDIGILREIYNSKKKFFVRFEDGREVEYSFDEAGQLVRAYAITVHKSQGCEFPAVVLTLLNAHYMMLQRHLVYTAMTRAKKLLVMVGSRRALELAVGNFRGEVRYSKLAERLRHEQNRLF